ncbi:hypothetical protein SBA2_40027 [Acidobacteriia bacterium SbA2]|nr:hypothetical protein SBA2_40027 [Acidobacteriia bacterium SbA2]
MRDKGLRLGFSVAHSCLLCFSSDPLACSVKRETCFPCSHLHYSSSNFLSKGCPSHTLPEENFCILWKTVYAGSDDRSEGKLGQTRPWKSGP